MVDFLTKRPGSGKGSPATQATWEDVMKELECARMKWENKAQVKGWKGFARRTSRESGEKVKMMTPWLNLVPNGDYGGIACGGLKLLFGVSLVPS
jgi:hypothetical protein